MRAYGDAQLAEQEHRPMQLPPGAPLGAFLSFRDLRNVGTSRLVADTPLPQLIAGLPRGTLALPRSRGRLPLHSAVASHASIEVTESADDTHKS